MPGRTPQRAHRELRQGNPPSLRLAESKIRRRIVLPAAGPPPSLLLPTCTDSMNCDRMDADASPSALLASESPCTEALASARAPLRAETLMALPSCTAAPDGNEPLPYLQAHHNVDKTMCLLCAQMRLWRGPAAKTVQQWRQANLTVR